MIAKTASPALYKTVPNSLKKNASKLSDEAKNHFIVGILVDILTFSIFCCQMRPTRKENTLL